VHRTVTLSAAGRSLRAEQSTVGRCITALESALGAASSTALADAGLALLPCDVTDGFPSLVRLLPPER
jgi:hypothetical protein